MTEILPGNILKLDCGCTLEMIPTDSGPNEAVLEVHACPLEEDCPHLLTTLTLLNQSGKLVDGTPIEKVYRDDSGD